MSRQKMIDSEHEHSPIAIGARVKLAPGKEHDEMTKGKVGTIKEVSTPALGIKFDGMKKVHKWYTSDEVVMLTTNDQADALGQKR